MTASVHHFGLLCPPGISHVTCLTAIARELGSRGHRATVFNIPDVAEIAAVEGVSFHALGAKAHPPGSFKAFADTMGGLHGIAAMRYGLKVAGAEILTLLDEAPQAMRAAGVTALLVDQGQPAGSTMRSEWGFRLSRCAMPRLQILTPRCHPPSRTGTTPTRGSGG